MAPLTHLELTVPPHLPSAHPSPRTHETPIKSRLSSIALYSAPSAVFALELPSPGSSSLAHFFHMINAPSAWDLKSAILAGATYVSSQISQHAPHSPSGRHIRHALRTSAPASHCERPHERPRVPTRREFVDRVTTLSAVPDSGHDPELLVPCHPWATTQPVRPAPRSLAPCRHFLGQRRD